MDNPRYDLAISFLSADEPLAVAIDDELTESLRVFVYSKRQEELAGTDGLESFRKTFLSEARLIVVLYREGWGKTRWTAVEELAIKDRMFNGGWKSLLFVMLDEHSTPPEWLPETHIRLSYAVYGKALIGAIKMRAQELGSTLRVETALEKARRSQSIIAARAERDQIFAQQGREALRSESALLWRALDDKIAEIQHHLSSMRLDHGSDRNEYIMRIGVVSVNLQVHDEMSMDKPRAVLQEFDGPLILPAERGRYSFLPGDAPRSVSKREFLFEYDLVRRWCWRAPDPRETLINTSELAEFVIKVGLDLHEAFDSGKRKRQRSTRYGEKSWMS